MSQPTPTTVFGLAVADKQHSRAELQPRQRAAQGRSGSKTGLMRTGLVSKMRPRQWVGLALNVGGLAVVLQSLAHYGVGA